MRGPSFMLWKHPFPHLKPMQDRDAERRAAPESGPGVRLTGVLWSSWGDGQGVLWSGCGRCSPSATFSMMPALCSTYVHAGVDRKVACLARNGPDNSQPRGQRSVVCTASSRKSAEPASWPRRAPVLGQTLGTRGRERSAAMQVKRCMAELTLDLPGDLPRHTFPKSIRTHQGRN